MVFNGDAFHITIVERSPVDAKLHAVLPCEGQEHKWTASAHEYYHSILMQANEVVYVGQEYSRDCMLKRNRYLVDHSSFLLGVYNGTRRSGTGATVRYAQQRGKIICILDPVARRITKEPVEKWNYM